MDNNSITIMIAILFVLIIYQQMQINKLSNNENFVDTNTVTTENLTAITILGNLAGDILTKNSLKIPGNKITNQSGGYFSIEDDGGNTLVLQSSDSTNKWVFNTYPTSNTNIPSRNLCIIGMTAAGLWTDPLLKIEPNGTLHIKGDLHVAGNIWPKQDD